MSNHNLITLLYNDRQIVEKTCNTTKYLNIKKISIINTIIKTNYIYNFKSLISP